MTHAIALPLQRPPRLAVALPIAFALAVGLTHLAEAPESAPEAPGCVGCHHADAAPAPDPAQSVRRAIAGLGR